MANRTMAVLFLISAAIQFNDPDPLRWAAIYGAAGFACLAAGRFRYSWPLPSGVGLLALVWAARLSPILPQVRLRDLARTMHAETPSIELGRELLGLVIVLAWMVVLVVDSRRKRPLRGSLP
jgi:hypothetical protein